jgi:hypothetical protein
MVLRPTAQRTDASLASRSTSRGAAIRNRDWKASLMRYCTTNPTSAMLASLVCMEVSGRTAGAPSAASIRTPNSSLLIEATFTISWLWTGGGRCQRRPGCDSVRT